MTQDWRQRKRLWRYLKTYSRATVQQAIADLRLPPETFRMIGIHDWQWIQRRIERKFYRRPYHERQPFPFMCIRIDAVVRPPWPHEFLSSLAPGETPVYAALGHEPTKLWWCRGTFEAAASVFVACRPQDIQLLLVPQTFDWLITVGHHDDLYSVGEPVSSKIAALNARLQPDAQSSQDSRRTAQ